MGESKVELGNPIVGEIGKIQIISGGAINPVLGTFIDTSVS
jgi:hypothetical protein